MRSQRLLPLIDLAKDGEAQAARAMADSRRRLEEQQRRLGDLQGYRHDYIAKGAAAGRQGVDAGELKRYKAFLARLDQVIALQSRQVERAGQDHAAKLALWTAARAKCRSLETAAARYREEERRVEDRREQRQSDDYGGAWSAMRREYDD